MQGDAPETRAAHSVRLVQLMRRMGFGGGRRRRGCRARRAVGATLALAVAGAACGGGGGGGGTDRAGGGDVEARGASLPEPVCDLLADWEETERPLLDPTGVFELDEAALGELLTSRREILGQLAERTEGELGSLLDDHLLSQAAFDEVMLDGWDEDRVRLAEAHDDRWLDTVLGEGVTRADGTHTTTGDYTTYRNMAYERLVIGCRAPELEGGPAQDPSGEPPAGRLVFLRPNDRYDLDAGGRLTVTEPSGEDESQLRPPADWTLQGAPDAVPTGDHGILVTARQGDEYATLVLSSTGEVLDTVQRAPGELGCPAWNHAGDQVLGTDNTSDADDRQMHLLDLTGDRPSGPLALPFAAVGCGDFVDDDRLVVGDAARELGVDRGVWTAGTDGSDPQELYTPEGCTVEVGSVDPGGDRVAVAQTCHDPLSDGVWVVDLSTGEADHVVTGHAALPKWSPDGEWLVFGFSPLGEHAVLGIWAVRADGTQLREVVEPLAYAPVWLPPA